MKGLVEDSIEMSLKAVQLNADFAPAHNNLAIAYLEKGHMIWRSSMLTKRWSWDMTWRLRS